MGRRKWITKKEAEAISKLPARKKKWYGFIMSALFLAVSIGYFCIFPTLSALGIITIICSVGFLIYGIVYTVIDNNEKAEKHKREEILLKSNIKQIDNMDGVTFENYLAMVFKQKGYNVTLTKTTGDYGVDLILSSKDNELTEKIIIQAKRYSKKVPISAVQQISAARDYYHTNDAWVITNNYFTQPAINLAKANDIKLIDRDMLAMLITSIQPNRTITHENPTIDNYANNEPVFQGSISKSDPVSIEMATTEDIDYNKKLFDIKNQILKIYPSFNLAEIKNQIEIAEHYKINNQKEYVSLHYFYNDIINIIYALREIEPTAYDYCLSLCDKDIETLKHTSLSNISVNSLTRKAICFEKQNKIAESIQICDYAIEHNFFDNGKSFGLRKIRLQKKFKM